MSNLSLSNKKILLGLSGGIAAYKVAEIVILLVKRKVEGKVMMTRAALEFVGPVTFETLSGNPVSSEIFPREQFSATQHIDLADWAEVVLLAPATANIIAKIYAGIADDLVTTVMLAVHSPIVIAPAMNTNMWHNPITQRNLQQLEKLGIIFVPPESGDLACGYVGDGRLAPTEEILQYCNFALAEKDLSGKKVLINAGPTIEDIDDVRFLSNRSSGKMGFALAYEAFCRGAEVTLISGPTHLTPPAGINFIKVRSAAQMLEAVREAHESCHIFIASAAVADYKTGKKIKGKIKKSREERLQLNLTQNLDILTELKAAKGKRKHIGFALETENGQQNAINKMNSKGLDAIILNQPLTDITGFESDTNEVYIYLPGETHHHLPLMDKSDLAVSIFDHLKEIL